MSFDRKTIWITWHDHQRTRSLVERLAIPVFVYDDHRPFARYSVGPLWTLWVLAKERPDVVFCHFSFALQLMILIYKYALRLGQVDIVSDCHNKALKREISGILSGLFGWFKSMVFRGVDLVVVTNTSLVPIARTLCGNVAVLRDPLANWHGEDVATRQERVGEGGHVLFVCSFDKDEPVDLIFEASLAITRELDMDVVISGRIPQERVPEPVRQNQRVKMPGFMPISEYRDTLFLAAAVVVLTEDEDCLVCGAYESLGASRSTVLSDTVSLRACFGESAVFTNHTPEGIVQQVREVLQRPSEARGARVAFQEAWDDEWEVLCLTLASLHE